MDSIFSQTNQDWRILARDDGSEDNTLSIIKDCITSHPDKVRLISDKNSRLGTCMNFGQLLEHSCAEYIMFTDQDDIWLPDKIELTFTMMKSAERVYPNTPLLVHTDLRVVGFDLSLVADSHWNSEKKIPSFCGDLHKVIVEP